jgi:hypothetical protein
VDLAVAGLLPDAIRAEVVLRHAAVKEHGQVVGAEGLDEGPGLCTAQGPVLDDGMELEAARAGRDVRRQRGVRIRVLGVVGAGEGDYAGFLLGDGPEVGEADVGREGKADAVRDPGLAHRAAEVL